MSVFHSTDNLPELRNTVITIGTFDGVHAGHQAILNQVVKHAKENNGTSVLVTFHPHPRKLIFPEQPIAILTPIEDKLDLITKIGIEHIIVVPFTKEFATLSAKEYVSEFLVKKFKPDTIIIGHDHHFGNDRKGNIELLNQLKEQYNFEVIEIEAQLIDEAAISSTKIRKAIASGDVTTALDMLDRPYSIKGSVVKGNQLGRTIGYPTANIAIQDAEQIIPATGVYAIQVIHNNALYNGMLNIGYRPTVSNEKSLHIEANIFDFEQDIYGDELTIQFIKRIRDEEKFNGITELKAQLKKDKSACLDTLPRIT